MPKMLCSLSSEASEDRARVHMIMSGASLCGLISSRHHAWMPLKLLLPYPPWPVHRTYLKVKTDATTWCRVRLRPYFASSEILFIWGTEKTESFNKRRRHGEENCLFAKVFRLLLKDRRGFSVPVLLRVPTKMSSTLRRLHLQTRG